MAILNGTHLGGSGPTDWSRQLYGTAGGDRVLSGLRLSHFAGLTVRLTNGAGGGQGVCGGSEFFMTDTQKDYTSTPNTAANPRVDRLVARRLWPSLEVEIAIKPGAPSTNPTPQPLTRDFGGVWEYGLGYWVVPGGSGGTIAGSKVWGRYADDGGKRSDDTDAICPTGRTTLLLAMEEPDLSTTQFAVAGGALVALDVTVSAKAQDVCAGKLLLDMAGQAMEVTWKAMAPGPVIVTAPRLTAPIDAYGGKVPAIVRMEVEGVLDAATPLRVGRVSARRHEVM